MNPVLMILSRFKPLTLLIAVALLAVAGCGKEGPSELKALRFVSGDSQLALPGQAFPLDLCVRLDGGNEPVSGKKVTFVPEEGADLALSVPEAVSDAGGLVRVRVTAGKRTGDNYLKIVPSDAPGKAVRARFTVGALLIGSEQEGRSGELLPEKVGVRLANSDGSPMTGVPVFLSPAGGKSGIGIERRSLTTDEAGVAVTEVRLPEGTGAGAVQIEFQSDKFDNPVRGVKARVLAIDYYTLIITVLGGLAFFVFGMKLMSEGLSIIAGKKMQSVLHFCAQNRFMAVIAGAVVTAVLQSSSASTVMVIGFVNAGLLSLTQSIGVVLGAHVGTTITAQLVAFDISALAMPAIILGLMVMFLAKNLLRGWGDAILGFGLIFFGMALMSTDLKSIAGYPSFIQFFRSFDCAPVAGALSLGAILGAFGIGLVATMILQSSAAVTGIIIALGGGGLINLYTAVPLMLGSNVGTTITAQLAAIPANRVAKQTALAHTLSNVIGVTVVVASLWIPWRDTGIPIFLYFVNAVTSGNAFAAIPENMPRHIANAHTFFNVFTTIMLIPFVGPLAKICSSLIFAEKKVKYQYLESHLLNNPSLAIDQAGFALQKMVKKAWELVDRAVHDHVIPAEADDKNVSAMDKKEQRVDRYQLEIQEYLSQIMLRELSPGQAAMIPPLMHCTNDAERIGDRAGNILALAVRLRDAEKKFSPKAESELVSIYSTLEALQEETLACLKAPSGRKIQKALQLEKEVGRLAEDYETAHIYRLNQGKCSVVTGIIFVELLSEFAAIARHFGNIAERTSSIRLTQKRPNAGNSAE